MVPGISTPPMATPPLAPVVLVDGWLTTPGWLSTPPPMADPEADTPPLDAPDQLLFAPHREIDDAEMDAMEERVDKEARRDVRQLRGLNERVIATMGPRRPMTEAFRKELAEESWRKELAEQAIASQVAAADQEVRAMKSARDDAEKKLREAEADLAAAVSKQRALKDLLLNSDDDLLLNVISDDD